MIILETERLVHKAFTPDDLPLLLQMRSDADVIRYIGGTKRQNFEELEKRLQFYVNCWKEYGFGFTKIFWKETGEPIGWSGLQPLEDTGEIEVGYGMIKEFWRKGIGFETGKAWVNYGFRQTNLERIVAVADPENTGSWRIMEKIGMKFDGIKSHYGFDCKVYSIEREDFLTDET